VSAALVGLLLLSHVHAWHGLPTFGDDQAAEAPPLELAPPPRSFTARVTGYCLAGRTRLGTPVRPGVVAVDPAVIPLGSRLLIEGLGGVYSAEDTGSAVRGASVDVWFASCADALAWGVRYRTIEVLP
jgi:3D (Asp-Asp-Asp) domain-containing protein